MLFESIVAFLANPMVLTPLGLALGAVLKRVPWFVTKAVPVMNILIAILIKAGAALVAPQQAFHFPGPDLGVDVVAAGFGGFLLKVVWEGVLQGAITTGFHSAAKNTVENAIGGKVKW